MSSKTIAKFLAFVILSLAAACGFSACGLSSKSYADQVTHTQLFSSPRTIGKIKNGDVTEASGITVSKCQPNVFWTHNDSGDDAFIFAINSNGDNLGTWRVTNAQNYDWEDIAEFKDASGKCFIYIGEIGDNKLAREVHTVYRVAEPSVTQATANSTQKTAGATVPADAVSFKYADANHNAETLMVHPVTGDIYVLAKNRKGPSGVYKIEPRFNTGVVQTATAIANIQVPSVPVGLLTGGDISSDGRRVVLCDYVDGYELTLPAGDNNFDDIWKQAPLRIDLGPRDTGEAVAYSLDGNTIFATTEGANAPIIEVQRK
jgi:hypothetical protein